MDRSSYSFLDYTVMPFLRKRVISSDASVLFSENFDKVLWANAVGTRLFGGNAVIDLLDTGLSQNHPLIRQLANAARQITDDEPIIRNFQISRGLKTETVRGEISKISLPNGENAILLSCSQDDPKHRYREHELAAMSVESLDSFADAAAIIDEYGLILASSRQFDAFEIDPAMLETLVNMVAREDDRLVKRPIQSGDGQTIAAGLGRIRDLPARFLVVLATAEPQEEDAEPTGGVFETASGGVFATAEQEADNSRYDSPSQAHPRGSVPDDEIITPEPLPPFRVGDETPDQEGREHNQADQTNAQPEDTNTPEESIAEISEDAREGSLLDRWYFDKSGDGNVGRDQTDHAADQETGADSENNQVTGPTAADETTAVGKSLEETKSQATNETQITPTRFAFTIDSNRIVQSVSPELVEAVGPESANIIGQSWEQIARSRGIDENGAINALLAKADTWSGRSVLWPVDNTDIAVPIDLAALPVFGKERSFEGFRGFGIIRLADAVVDPSGRGLTIALGQSQQTGGSTQSNEVINGEPETDEGMLGWRSDLDEEDNAPDSFEVASADTPETQISGPDENAAEAKDVDADHPGEKPPEKDRDNIFHLPNYRTDGRANQKPQADIDPSDALFSVPSDFGDTGEEPASSEDVSQSTKTHSPELNGREKQAFGEIRRTLSKDEAENNITGEDAPSDEVPPDSESSVLANLPVPLLVYQASKTLFANDALLEQTGYASTRELANAGGVDALLASEEVDTTSSIRNKNGDLIPVRSRLTKVDWNGENALCLSFERQDDRAEGSVPLSAAHEKTALDMVRVTELENILETAADGLLIIDAQGRIESLNTSGEALFSRDQSEVLGKPFTSLFASESRNTLEKHLEDLKTQGETSFAHHGQEVIGIEASGGFIPLFAMIGKVGSSGRFCAVLRDLTDWKKTEEELVEAKRKAETANDQKSEFLSRVSHEIREPLTSIIGFSDVMIEERFGKIENERYREYLKDINRSGIHVLDLVNDLLDISKIEAGKLELSYEAVDLNQLASETVALLQPKANHKRIIIRTSLSRAVPKVVADARSIRQIILNLVSNAIQHSHRNSQVIVSTTYEENGEVALRIRDTGNGMSEAELKRALEPFAQLGEDRMENPAGTGLGLPLTKALVEANRAYFELESEKGEGTIAHIQFPSQRVLAD